LFLLASFLPLAAEIKVTAISGSLRKGSVNKKLLEQAVKIAREMGATVTVIDLKDYPIPFYDADLESAEGMPPYAKKLRDSWVSSDALLIATPEYNGSLTAVLKNAIDWVSRSEDGKSSRAAFDGKRFAIMSASPGKRGGARALKHLRDIIECEGGTVIEKQVAIANAYQQFEGDRAPDLKDLREEIRQLLQN